eukprot:UN25452
MTTSSRQRSFGGVADCYSMKKNLQRNQLPKNRTKPGKTREKSFGGVADLMAEDSDEENNNNETQTQKNTRGRSDKSYGGVADLMANEYEDREEKHRHRPPLVNEIAEEL